MAAMLSPEKTPKSRGWQREHAKQRIGKPLTWRCPRCGSPPGQFCVSKNGREISSIGNTHNARIMHGKKLSKSYRAWT
jgi:hypothetical protein